MRRRTRVITALGLALAFVAISTAPVASVATPHAARTTAAPTIMVLSNRADLVAGGEALVAVALPKGTNPVQVRIRLGSRDLTSEFAQRTNGQYEGLLTGLAVGGNVLTAMLPGGASASRTIIDHAVGGPLFSGPQVKPWVCTNGSKNPQCNAPATYSYQLMSSVTHSFQTYDPSNPPADVATTTTQTGATVPFIVRAETGYQDRDQYRSRSSSSRASRGVRGRRSRSSTTSC
jgi:hypothetical protein